MAEFGERTVTGPTGTTERPARRRMPDPLTLLVGLFSLAVAGSAFVGRMPAMTMFDPRWLLAGGAVVFGVLLLVGSLRNRQDR
ncbi:hypothetical protein [Pseudonocardia acidicola]|uniref:Uncharacterized protein n=1 Tax=Pseudonocardia acidicola TaxID=2724939 RepID=A0ABX1SG17_9PSEU|nr:hypothetical protein [Pseudonocardia acidicola]NMH99103.1 hypothetical protein [Pseudonocardia acidicola]